MFRALQQAVEMVVDQRQTGLPYQQAKEFVAAGQFMKRYLITTQR